jgi:hypothetical protein
MNDTSTIYFDPIRSLSDIQENKVLEKLTTKAT